MSKTRRALLTLLALALLTGPLKLLLAAMLPDRAVDPVPGCLAGMALSLLLLGLPAWLLRPWTSPRLTQQKSAWRGLVLAAAAALLTRAAMVPADVAWQSAFGLTPDAMPVPANVPLAMVYIAALAIVPALTEEAFFRGALLTGVLDGARRTTAVLLTTLAFALMHGNAANLPSLLVLSLLLTLLMLHTGRIAVPMAAHLVYNLTALNGTIIPGWGSILCGIGLVVMGVGMIARQPKIAHQPMIWADRLMAAAAIAMLLTMYFI